MGHVNSVLMALSKCPNPTVFQKTLGLNDFYFGSPEWEFPMGHISFVGRLDGATLSAGAPAIAPGWTLDLMGKHSLDFWLTSEDLPDPDNRVTLDRDGKIVLSYTPNYGEAHRRLIQKPERLMQQQTKCAVHGHDCHQGLFARIFSWAGGLEHLPDELLARMGVDAEQLVALRSASSGTRP
jgi:hypothetical protein